MPLPRIAIVGRPNVGKSSLMNMIAGAKVSIVDPTPGVTRDRVTAIVDLPPPFREKGYTKTAEFIDTGGFGVYVAEGERFDEIGNDLTALTESIEFQIAQAVLNADIVLFAVDAQAGITAHDREIARMLRERALGKKRKGKGKYSPSDGTVPTKPPEIKLVATKVDGPRWESHGHELAALGFGEPMLISCKNNYMRRDFMDTIYEMLPEPDETMVRDSRPDLAVAIIGKRNSGKSTLINVLAGEPRVIVSEIPGTTRDAVDVRFDIDGKSVVAIDTAGLRRKRSFQNMIEHFAFDRVQRAVDRSDVVILLIDATEKLSQVDEQLAMLIQKAYKPCIIVVNKWDLVEGAKDDKGKPVTTKKYEEYLRKELGGLNFAPISFTSGITGRNVRATINLALELREQSCHRVTTGKLNRLIRGILETSSPTDIKGTFAKVYFVAQTGIEPPTITLVVNHPDLFRPGYLRFLMNRFREELPFGEVPIRIVVRARRQREDDLYEGKEGPARIARGRKGVNERTKARMSKPTEGIEFGEELLDDAHSQVINVDAFSDDPDVYFDDDDE
ncbi:MAG: 50S ribosome-binding GTPase [Planctomycetota bacterium]|nr:50S ribosome-binding GTPase [Planctomycetota bacterium]